MPLRFERPVVYPGADGYFVTARGAVISMRQGTRRVLKAAPHYRVGYLLVALRVGVQTKSFFVHQLVLHAFRGPRPSEDHQARHLDGNRRNNRLTNLVWGTRAENGLDKAKHGRLKGERHGNAKLSNAQAEEIKQLAENGMRQHEIAGRFGISRPHVSKIVSGARRGA